MNHNQDCGCPDCIEHGGQRGWEEPALPEVAGRVMDCTLGFFEQRCRVHIRDEQARPNANSALIALLCDAVRLARECCDSKSAWIAVAQTEQNPYKWRPISEIHEDCGPCVLINLIEDGSHVEIGHVGDADFQIERWTHFAESPKLTTEEAEILIAAMQGAKP